MNPDVVPTIALNLHLANVNPCPFAYGKLPRDNVSVDIVVLASRRMHSELVVRLYRQRNDAPIRAWISGVRTECYGITIAE